MRRRIKIASFTANGAGSSAGNLSRKQLHKQTQLHSHKVALNSATERANEGSEIGEKSCASSDFAAEASRLDVLTRAVKRSGLTHESFVKAITSTAFGRLIVWSQLDLERLLLTAERLGLDPVGSEIFALPSQELDGQGVARGEASGKPLQLALTVDGWCRVINAHPQFDGISFRESSDSQQDGLPTFIECSIYRRDRRAVTRIREYMCEANTGAGAWLTHPRRMLRHKAMVQCARVCFGMGDVLELDEAQRAHSARPANAAPSGPARHFGSIGPQGTHALKEWLNSKHTR